MNSFGWHLKHTLPHKRGFAEFNIYSVIVLAILIALAILCMIYCYPRYKDDIMFFGELLTFLTNKSIY